MEKEEILTPRDFRGTWIPLSQNVFFVMFFIHNIINGLQFYFIDHATQNTH